MATKYAGDSALRYFKTKLVALINAAKGAADSAQATADSAASAAATAQSTANGAVSAANANTSAIAAEASRAKAAETAAKLAAWPIGSYYFSASNTSPAGTVGGTWASVALGIVQDSTGAAIYAWKRTA